MVVVVLQDFEMRVQASDDISLERGLSERESEVGSTASTKSVSVERFDIESPKITANACAERYIIISTITSEVS